MSEQIERAKAQIGYREIFAECIMRRDSREVNLAERVRLGIDNSTGGTAAIEAIEKCVAIERKRCADILQLARAGEIDQDFRVICSRIEGGDTIESIKAEKP